MRHAILLVILASVCGATPVFNCTVSDSSGNVVSNSCAGREGTYGYHSDVEAGATTQGWGVLVDAGFYVSNDYYSPYKTSISLSDYAAFSLPMVVSGGVGSAYLWYSGYFYSGDRYYSSYGVKFGSVGYLSAQVSAPCYYDTPRNTDVSFNCYIPFTYDVPFTISGYASVSGNLSGGLENDGWYYHSSARLMGIVTDQGSQQLTAQDVTIQAMPEPTMFPALMLAMGLGAYGYRRSAIRRDQ